MSTQSGSAFTNEQLRKVTNNMPILSSSAFFDIIYEDIKYKFAFFPTVDMNGKRLWLKHYWEYSDRCEVGFFVLRGSTKEYVTKQAFWNSVRFRIPNIVDICRGTL